MDSKCDECGTALQENPVKACNSCRQLMCMTLQSNGFKQDGRYWSRQESGEQFSTTEMAWRALLDEQAAEQYYENLNDELVR